MYTIRISTPLTLKNLLCCPISYKLSTNPQLLLSKQQKQQQQQQAQTQKQLQQPAKEGEEGVVAKGSLPDIDDRDSIFAFPLDDHNDLPVYLAIKVPQYGWSTAVIINRDNVGKEKVVDDPQMFTLIAEGGFELNLFYLKR